MWTSLTVTHLCTVLYKVEQNVFMFYLTFVYLLDFSFGIFFLDVTSSKRLPLHTSTRRELETTKIRNAGKEISNVIKTKIQTKKNNPRISDKTLYLTNFNTQTAFKAHRIGNIRLRKCDKNEPNLSHTTTTSLYSTCNVKFFRMYVCLLNFKPRENLLVLVAL